MERLKECVKELLKFTLQSYIDKSLNFELGFSPEFCSNLLISDPSHCNSNPADVLKGVPSYPLYKHLALALYQSTVSGSICNRHDNWELMRDDISRKQKEEWSELVSTKGLELINLMKNIDLELHVEEPFFSMLRDGSKTVEGRCAVGKYNHIEPGDKILFNNCLLLEVQAVRHYATFFKLLEAETLSQVLPGVRSIEEEEKERCNGVLAICVSSFAAQPSILLASILSELSYEGVQSLLGLSHTAGTISGALPPPKSTLLSSFMLPYYPDVKGSTLTHGARALSKHVDRSSNKFWGNLNGSDSDKNNLAAGVITHLISNCCWLNVYFVQPHGSVFEIRVAEGYGARWSKDGAKFIGFLEPYIDDGHLRGWKH